MDPTDDPPILAAAELLDEMLQIRAAATEAEERRRGDLDRLPEETRASGTNLVHYLAIRQLDLRREQRSLARLGLSSLGRAEPHVLATIDAAIARLAAESPGRDLPDDLGRRGPTADHADQLLALHTQTAIGPTVGGRGTRLMVTLPTEAAHDRALVTRLVASGMSIARVNAAHDDVEHWRSMIANVRRAAADAGREVKVAIDLPGPKLRTGPLPAGPQVVRARPARDDLGRVERPVLIRFTSDPDPETVADGDRGEPLTVPVRDDLLAAVRPGDELRLRDARGRRRDLQVLSVGSTMCEAESDRTVYFTSGLPVDVRRNGKTVFTTSVGEIPARASAITLRAGDALELRPGTKPGGPAVLAADGAVERRAHVTVDVDALFESVRVGDRVMLDDGTFEGLAVRVDDSRIVLEITRPARGRLRAGKGINLPDTELPIPGLTDDDVSIVEAMADEVDLVAMSFVSVDDDVHRLHRLLDRLGADGVGVILKIERRTAMDNLPHLLLATLSRPPAALMVARGDLAVEVGFDSLPELQEEILWFGAAAHTPVILATQVLESLAKRGAPTRAEVTDAAWASRADCVMLNKGPFIPETMEFLDGLLTRMEQRRDRRTPLLRQLSAALPWGAST